MPFDYLTVLRKNLERLRDRYFSPTISHPNGDLNHLPACNSGRDMELYRYAPCTCGLLHDLNPHACLDKIYPDWQEEKAKGDAMIPGHLYWMSDEEKAAVRQRMKEMTARMPKQFPVLNLDSWENEEWEIIEEVFGEEFCTRKQIDFLSKNISKTIAGQPEYKYWFVKLPKPRPDLLQKPKYVRIEWVMSSKSHYHDGPMMSLDEYIVPANKWFFVFCMHETHAYVQDAGDNKKTFDVFVEYENQNCVPIWRWHLVPTLIEIHR